jgi:hypothetical protein
MCNYLRSPLPLLRHGRMPRTNSGGGTVGTVTPGGILESTFIGSSKKPLVSGRVRLASPIALFNANRCLHVTITARSDSHREDCRRGLQPYF